MENFLLLFCDKLDFIVTHLVLVSYSNYEYFLFSHYVSKDYTVKGPIYITTHIP